MKLLASLITGIIIQRHGVFSPDMIRVMLIAGILALFIFRFLPFFNRYRYAWFPGIAVYTVFLSIGALLTEKKDIRNHGNWIGNNYREGDAIVAELEEPLTEKPGTFKAVATAITILSNNVPVPVSGKIIVYFRKDSTGILPAKLNHSAGPGTRIIFLNKPGDIRNSGNPGGFDYRSYSLYRGITHQVFLQENEFERVPGKRPGAIQRWLHSLRAYVLGLLRKYIAGEKETGLAEALLIGYRNDLDPELVRSYSQTGVVHIIAISGLHIGLIYWLLSLLFSPLTKKKETKWLGTVLILAGLWLFSLLAGAQPSVLRSAWMFSFIILGESLGRKTYTFNSIAASAFLLLCINPFWLWDIGFQLSYAAVVSIILFMRPVYNWFYCKNRILDLAWKMNAVTLAAQCITLPLCIYHFHQFPVYFLLGNFIAVPLSSLILLAELFLCAISFIPSAALWTGQFISGAIRLMNRFVEQVERLPGSVWEGLQITEWQVVLLLLLVASFTHWLMEKSVRSLIGSLLLLTGFTALRTISFIERNRQKLILVYNIPQKRAMDFIDGRNYFFVGDSDLIRPSFAWNFHLRPARSRLRLFPNPQMNEFVLDGRHIWFGGKRILLVDKPLRLAPGSRRDTIDLLVISRNPRFYINQLTEALTVKQVVFDGSTAAWKVNYWKKDCDSLRIPWHDVRENGAFVMRLR